MALDGRSAGRAIEEARGLGEAPVAMTRSHDPGRSTPGLCEIGEQVARLGWKECTGGLTIHA